MDSGGVTLRRPGGFPAVFRKITAIVRISLLSRLTYIGETLVRSIFLLLILFTFSQLWEATQGSQNVLGLTGFTVAQLIWYLAFTEAIMMSAPYFTELEVDREVRSGDIAYRMARPLAYPLFHLGSGLGERFFRFAMHLSIGCVVALLLVGPIPLSLLSVAAALLTALLAFLVDWVLTFSISLLSFWIEDTLGLHLLYRRSLMLLGGMLIPLEAYPSWLGEIARALPFQFLVYQPGRYFVQMDIDGLPAVLATQIGLLLAGLVPMLVLFRVGQRRMSAQGG